MTGTINKTFILGNLGRDPEIHVAKSGTEIARFTVATSDRFTDKNGEKQERTEWHRVVVFGDSLINKVIKPYLNRSSKVHIQGSLRTDKYTDKNGVERYSTDIVVEELTLLDGKSSASNGKQ